MTVAPIASSSAVVMPGRTARFMASSMRRTIAPAARMAARSSGPLMDMHLAYRISRTAKAEKLNRSLLGLDGSLRLRSGQAPTRPHTAYGSSLRAGNFQAEFFGQALADFRGQAVVDAARAQFGGVDHRHGCGCRDCHSQPDQGGKRESHQRGQFQPKGMPGIEMEDHAKRHQEDRARKRGQGDQREVNIAMQVLARTAVSTTVEVLFIIFTHLWRKAGDVITPAGKYFSNNGINALAHRS